MPRRRADPIDASVSPETIWLAMTGRLATSRGAADGEQDLAGAWLDMMHTLVREGVDETNPEDVRRLLPGTALDELRAEAEVHHFKPWAIRGCVPNGQGYERWRLEFLARHDRRRVG